MKASTYRYVTTASCVAVALMLLPLIVGAFVLRINNTEIPENLHSDVRVMFYAGVGWTAWKAGLPEDGIPRRTFEKAMLIANDQVEVVFDDYSEDLRDEFKKLRDGAARGAGVWIIKTSGSADGKIRYTTPRICADALRAYIARIKAGEKIDWQVEVDAYNLAQMEAE